MSKLEFHRVYYKRYDTSRINIRNRILVLKENCEVLKIDEKEYGYQKAVVQLDQPDLMKNWEEQINEYLKGEGIPPINFFIVIRFTLKPKYIIQLKQVLLKLIVCGLTLRINLFYSYG